MRRNKFRAKPTVVDGIRFDSKRESQHYTYLKSLVAAGEISDLALQPSYDIVINGQKICKVKLDFSYMKDGEFIVEDVKGMDTPMSRLKRKLVKACHDIDVVIIK